jgi:hypothetical protein
MHHRSFGICLWTTLLGLAAAGCSISNNGGGSTGGNPAAGTTAVAGNTSGGGSQGIAGASGGDSTPIGGTGGSTQPPNTGGSTQPPNTGGSTQPPNTGGSTIPNTTAANGGGGATSSSTTSSVAGSRDAGVAGSGGSSLAGAGGNRDGGPAGGTASGGTGGRATGGNATGGRATGGRATGGSATGGKSTGGSATGGSSTGGSANGGSTGTPPTPGKVFSQCRFHFGTIDSIAKSNTSMISQLDFFTPGWMMGTFNQKYVCDESAPGGALAGLVPVDVTYIAANYVKGQNKLCDCNVSGCAGGNLCNYGAQYITQDWATILSQYQSNSTGFAGCLSGRPIVFEMEPDWYQYYAGGQTQAWTPAQAGTNMTALVNALKGSLPNAVFSMDISPWIPNNGSAWYTNFNMSLFTFINTSGGGTAANNTKIRSNNAMTWAGVHGVAGKPILADTGYGANGGSAGPDAAWDVPANINARIADGVVSISQYNPSSSWGSTISGIRSQLNTPSVCP